MWNKVKGLFKNRIPGDSNTPETFTHSQQKNLIILQDSFKKVGDYKTRKITLRGNSDQQVKIVLAYLEELIDKNLINDNILKPILFQHPESRLDLNKGKLGQEICEKILNVQEINNTKNVEEVISKILIGYTAILIEGVSVIYLVPTQGWEERKSATPVVERSVRGPKLAFVETLKYNLGFIRKYVRSDRLKVEYFTKGEYSRTQLAVVYLEGVANQEIIKEVKKRLDTINTAQINGCTQVMELIEDNPSSLFDTMYETERVDVINGGLFEGRVAILTDGCPTALMVPKLFMENFISPEDYYTRYWYTLVIRSIRFIGFLISTMLPGIYISVLSFHQELIPMTLVRTIYTSREGVPFPIVLEMLIFLFFFEAIKEAGARIPSSLGASISIVGALILGQAAITAGFLSADGVIIGSLTGIAIFLTPLIEFNQALIIIRIAFILVAGFTGLYGMVLLIFIITGHLCSMRSFGIPVTSPLAPMHFGDLKDFVVRVPYLIMNTRPESLENENKIRQGNRPVRRFFFKYRVDKEG